VPSHVSRVPVLRMQNRFSGAERITGQRQGESGHRLSTLRYGTQLLQESWDRFPPRSAAGAAGSGRRDEAYDTMLGEIIT